MGNSGATPGGLAVRARGILSAGIVVALVSSGTLLVGAQPFDELWIASFNIQFLGTSSKRDNAALASLFAQHDIVVVQELVAAPIEGTFPDGGAFRVDPEAADFVQEMENLGFQWVLSPEDTGPGANNHTNAFTTEWWITFFNPTTVRVAEDLPIGFLSEDRTANAQFDRVPFAFPFRTANGGLDFVLISVHLNPDDDDAGVARRREEVSAVAAWIGQHQQTERDFIILGDMNFQDCDEMHAALPTGFESVNDGCLPTNTHTGAGKAKPFDHVLFRRADTTELDLEAGFFVIDLIEEMRPFWNGPGAYPGEPYDHNRFRAVYSDHDPVDFVMSIPAADDDT